MENHDYRLQMLDITKRFPGVIANEKVTIECHRGEVLGLLGENGAGKTTLMNCLYGIYTPDEGKILIDGHEVRIASPSEALANGIGMVHQHFKLVDTLTVLENIMLGLPAKRQKIDFAPVRRKLLALCEEYGFHVDPDAQVWSLPVGQQQWVEILKALYRDVKVLVLDEPTAVLTPAESDQLVRVIQKLKEEGRSIIFISHKLREVLEVTDRVTVLRDGKCVGTVDTKEATQISLAKMMVGRSVSIERKSRPAMHDQKVVLEMTNVCANDDRGIPALKNLNLEVHAGEIVGVAGVDGNGQKELAECIVGLRKTTAGEITVDGKRVTNVIADPSFIGFIPEDRQKTGLVMDFSITENLIMKDNGRSPYAKHGILNRKAVQDHAKQMIETFHIKTPSANVKVKNLSGGNQQKVVIARELCNEPLFEIAAQPTRGLDLGAVANVHDILLRERNRGAAILFISAELQEIMALSDRIIVMFGGEITGDVGAETADTTTIGQMMLGHVSED
jgi:simple sugar transport system ATP-binding protein